MTDVKNMQMRDAFITGLLERASADRDILFISDEYGAPALDRFREILPGQFINAGISEQNIISVAAGLATGGKKVFVYSIASFITLRCFEQLKLDLCCHKLPVTIVGVGTCYAYSQDGPTHHATEDIAVMRALAGMEIYSPSDAQLAHELVDISLNTTAPSYIRLDKGIFSPLSEEKTDWDRGFRILRTGGDLCIVSTGIMVHRALEVAEKLAVQGIRASVIDLFKLKPIGESHIIETFRSFNRVVSIEEHTITGGLGSILAELIVDNGLPVRLKRIAVKEAALYTYGVRDTLQKDLGLDTDNIIKSISEWLRKIK